MRVCEDSGVVHKTMTRQSPGRHMPAAMLRRLFLVLLLGLGYGHGQTTIPDTLAGHTLQAWLEAFNSGDRTKIDAYVKTLDPKQSADQLMAFRNQTGGFNLVAIESSQPLSIKFRVKEKASSTIAIGSMQVRDTRPATVENFNLHAIPPGAVIENSQTRRCDPAASD